MLKIKELLKRLRFWIFGGVYELPDGDGANGQPPIWKRVL